MGPHNRWLLLLTINQQSRTTTWMELQLESMKTATSSSFGHGHWAGAWYYWSAEASCWGIAKINLNELSLTSGKHWLCRSYAILNTCQLSNLSTMTNLTLSASARQLFQSFRGKRSVGVEVCRSRRCIFSEEWPSLTGKQEWVGVSDSGSDSSRWGKQVVVTRRDERRNKAPTNRRRGKGTVDQWEAWK